jgi:hypothetical protein
VVVVLALTVVAVVVEVQEEVAELVRCAEDPALDRDALPGVDHDGGATVRRTDREAEEAVRGDRHGEDLHAGRVEQPADVADRLVRGEPEGGPRRTRGGDRALLAWARRSGDALEAERAVLAEQLLERVVVGEPAPHLGEDMASGA